MLSLIILERSKEAYHTWVRMLLSRGKEGKGPDMLGVLRNSKAATVAEAGSRREMEGHGDQIT